MNKRILAALAQLNAVYADTGRQYSIIEDHKYILVMPNGGYYPPTDKDGMVKRLVNLRIAATGRDA